MGNLTQNVQPKAATMSSLDLVAFINSERDEGQAKLRHDHFMAKVPKVLGDQAPNFLGTSEYTANGVTHSRRIYNFPKREACLMAMSYSYELQAKVFDRMTELEEQVAQPYQLPKSMSEALRLAADQAEQIEQQQAQIEQAKPAVEFVGRFVEAGTTKSIREVAKILGLPEKAFIKAMIDDKILYRQSGSLLPHQKHHHAERFDVKTGERNGHAYTQTRVTSTGVDYLARFYGDWIGEGAA